MTGNYSIVSFLANSSRAIGSALDQWDYGQALFIKGLSADLPASFEVHFATLGKTDEAALRQTVAYNGDGTLTVAIPNRYLERAGTIQAFVYVSDASHGQTLYQAQIPVNARPMPSTNL